MDNFHEIINWENVFKQSKSFKKQKPFRFAFIEEFFKRDFYEKLYQTYPKIDKTWIVASDYSKYQLNRFWGKSGPLEIVDDEYDPKFSPEWNTFKKYAHTKEFAENFKKFSDVPVTNLKHFHLIYLTKGGFQLPHIHNVGPSTLILMIYFSKNWKKGDPGGTYMASEEDESKIIFEPYNLDNSMAIFHDSSHAAHGTRYITKDVERRALQITLEEYDQMNGWSGGNPQLIRKERSRKSKELS